MAEVIYLTSGDFEIICWELNLFFTKQKDPPPKYEQTYFDKLDSIIAIPRKTYDKKDLYKSVYKKAACYFYFINKLHPFANGNKRISIVSTGVFLLYNEIEFEADEEVMYEFAKKIAMSRKKQEEEFSQVVSFIEKHAHPRTHSQEPRFVFDMLRRLTRRK